MQNFIKILFAAGCVCVVLGANATPVYVNPLGDGIDTSLSLQSQINARGNTLIDVNSGQVDIGTAAAWTSSGNYFAAMMLETAGSAALNTFGIYNLADPSQKMQVFSGPDTGGAMTIFASPFATFGFYMFNGRFETTWYSDNLLNGGDAHVVAYQGQGEILNLGDEASSPAGSVVLDPNSYLMGWEDLDFSYSDRDYNDMVVLVGNVQTVPDDFATAGLLWAVLLGLFFLKSARIAQHRRQPAKALARRNRTSRRV